MDKKNGISKGVIIGTVIVVLLVGLVVCGAFYYSNNQPENVEEQTLNGGRVSLTYTDEENIFSIENAVPTSDVVGMAYDSANLFFDFTVKTEIEEANYVEYEIILVKDDALSTSLNENIKVYLEKEMSGTYTEVTGPKVFVPDVQDVGLGENAMTVYSNKKMSNGNDNFRLRFWLSDTAQFNSGEVQNFGVKILVRAVAK